MKTVKSLPLCAILTVALSMALLRHFSNIWRYGQYIIQEPNIVVLVLETLMMILSAIIGLVSFKKWWRGNR